MLLGSYVCTMFIIWQLYNIFIKKKEACTILVIAALAHFLGNQMFSHHQTFDIGIELAQHCANMRSISTLASMGQLRASGHASARPILNFQYGPNDDVYIDPTLAQYIFAIWEEADRWTYNTGSPEPRMEPPLDSRA